jgi:hypothetical protein
VGADALPLRARGRVAVPWVSIGPRRVAAGYGGGFAAARSRLWWRAAWAPGSPGPRTAPRIPRSAR